MSIRVGVKKTLLDWAAERSGINPEQLRLRFPKLEEWRSGTTEPTMNQLEDFSSYTHAPMGYLLLSEPPVEIIPIPDFRTVAHSRFSHPSPDLLEMIYICQQRQEWYRDFARETGEMPLPFVGKATIHSDIKKTASDIRNTIGLDLEKRSTYSTWTDALRSSINHADEAGILVMCSGVVLNNNYRHLDPQEFRGFSLADDLAPLVFINGSDTKAAQMFTLAHELAHIWLGSTGLSDIPTENESQNETEKWCNQVAAEILVPFVNLCELFNKSVPINSEISSLARHFKVSTLVIIRRLRDAHFISSEQFLNLYVNEEEKLKIIPRKSGGDFYLTQAARASKRFTRALIISTLEGQTLHRDAFRFLGFSKIETFKQLGQSLGVL